MTKDDKKLFIEAIPAEFPSITFDANLINRWRRTLDKMYLTPSDSLAIDFMEVALKLGILRSDSDIDSQIKYAQKNTGHLYPAGINPKKRR